jgi:hypothetical protein
MISNQIYIEKSKNNVNSSYSYNKNKSNSDDVNSKLAIILKRAKIIAKNKKPNINPFNLVLNNDVYCTIFITIFVFLISSVESNPNVNSDNSKHSNNDHHEFSQIDKCHLIPSKDQV